MADISKITGLRSVPGLLKRASDAIKLPANELSDTQKSLFMDRKDPEKASPEALIRALHAGLKNDLTEALESHPGPCLGIFKRLFAFITPSSATAAMVSVKAEFSDALTERPEWDRLIKVALSGKIPKTEIGWLVEVGERLKANALSEHELKLQTFLLRKQPEFYWPYFRVGVILFENGHPQEALDALRTSTQLNPDFAWSWFFRAMAEDVLLGAESALVSLKRAVSLADDDAFNLFLYAFISLAKLPWTEAASLALARVVRQNAFSDEDLRKATEAFFGAATHAPKAILIPTFLDALREDVAGSDGRHGSNNWWPIHTMTAIVAIEQRAPQALSLIARAEFALSIAFSRREAQVYYQEYIQKMVDALCHRLSVLPRESWTQTLAHEILALSELCLVSFDDPVISGRLLELVESSPAGQGLHKRINLLRLELLKARNAQFELRFLLSRIEAEPYAQNADILKSRISTMLTISEKSGPALLDAIENVLSICETSSILSAYDISTIIKDLEQRADIAFGLTYSQYKVRGNEGNGRAEGAQWAAYVHRLAEVVTRIEAQRHNLSSGPRALLARHKAVIFTSPYIPQVRHYRAEQMAELLEILDMPFEMYDLNTLSAEKARFICADASVIIIQRQPATVLVIGLMSWARSMNIKVIYDIDDLIFDSHHFPPPLSDYAGNIDRATHVHLIFDCPIFQEALNWSDEIIVSTLPLKARVEDVLRSPRRIHLRRNYVGGAVQMAVARNIEKAKSRSASKHVNIFYGSGTKAHKEFFETTVVPALVNTLKTYPQSRLVLIGHFPDMSPFEPVMPQVVIEEPGLTFDSYLDRLADNHINIAPLDITPATDAKSELKWFEAASLGIPSVVSPTQNYVDVLQDGTHVLFATSQKEWEEALGRLVIDSSLRETLVSQSRSLIAERYVPEYWANQLLCDDVLTNSRLETSRAVVNVRKKRLLIVNSFFWPQSVGGATRIVESYIDELNKTNGDEFEIFVLCANANPKANADYETDIFWYKGAVVIQVNVPPRDWADALDERVQALTEDIIGRFRIDVAHLHSVQILTASVAVALQRRSIPIILTLHDGWWLSEHQFLVDEEGKAFLPDAQGTEIYRSVTHRFTAVERLQRRKTLKAIVKSCRQVLAVSETFAQVYKDAGFNGVGVHENGVNPTRLTTTRHRPEGIVRLGFIGGRSDHKGYGLLCRALLEGGLNHIELVVVDHAKPYGYEREGIMGDSRVLTVGKFPQDRVAELYAKFDVLAAPSIWPESYGLVVREARFAGVPVLVSNKGDIGRGVEENVDGWVVDVEKPNALRNLLERLNADTSLADITPREPEVVSVQTAVNQLVDRLRQETWPH